MRIVAIVAVGTLAFACGDDSGGPGAGTVTVSFSYLAPTAIDPAVQNDFPGCVAGVGMTHIHPSWRGFARVNMTAADTSRWEISFDDAPVGRELAVRISDPNVCAENPTGAATRGALANDVELTRIVDTPGNGVEPGFGFSVAANGTVTP